MEEWGTTKLCKWVGLVCGGLRPEVVEQATCFIGWHSRCLYGEFFFLAPCSFAVFPLATQFWHEGASNSVIQLFLTALRPLVFRPTPVLAVSWAGVPEPRTSSCPHSSLLLLGYSFPCTTKTVIVPLTSSWVPNTRGNLVLLSLPHVLSLSLS